MTRQLGDEEGHVPVSMQLDDDADAGDEQRGGPRRAIGIALVVVGVVVAALAAWSVLGHRGTSERKVGKLTASHIGVAKGSSASSSSTKTTSGGASTPSTAAPAPTVAAKPAWPLAVSGRPPALGKQGEPPPSSAGSLDDGFYLWQDFDGWHLWIVGGSNQTATVTVDDKIAKAEPVGGSVQIDTSANTFTVSRGSASAAVVGVDFNPGYYAKTMVVAVDGNLRLHVGARRFTAPDFYGIQYSTANG